MQEVTIKILEKEDPKSIILADILVNNFLLLDGNVKLKIIEKLLDLTKVGDDFGKFGRDNPSIQR